MLRLIIGNKNYSSWSLRGWLACKQSGLPFAEEVAPLYNDAWTATRAGPDFAPSAGQVPILWDGDIAVWDSLAILEYLADQVGRDRFWPADAAARGLARAMVAEMHSGYAALRQACTMNARRRYPPAPLAADVAADVDRIVDLWQRARALRHGEGPFLFGAFGAADIAFAPVVTRFATYAIPLPDFARNYGAAVLAHPFLVEWLTAAEAEPWTIDRFELT